MIIRQDLINECHLHEIIQFYQYGHPGHRKKLIIAGPEEKNNVKTIEKHIKILFFGCPWCPYSYLKIDIITIDTHSAS